MNKNKRTIRRGIFFFILGVIVILLCGSFSVKGQPEAVEEYQVVQGDTLWGIAKEHKPNSVSYRDYIGLLQKLNDGLTADIHSGEVILVPVYEE